MSIWIVSQSFWLGLYYVITGCSAQALMRNYGAMVSFVLIGSIKQIDRLMYSYTLLFFFCFEIITRPASIKGAG